MGKLGWLVAGVAVGGGLLWLYAHRRGIYLGIKYGEEIDATATIAQDLSGVYEGFKQLVGGTREGG